MIVRILSDNQYRLDDHYQTAIDQLDDRLLEAADHDDEATFADVFSQLLRLIWENGLPVASDELVTSDVILPAPDMTLQEVQRSFKQSVFA